jgi:hypothetical protein
VTIDRRRFLAAASGLMGEDCDGQQGARVFHKFQAMLSRWDRVAEGAYHQFVAL